MRKVCAKCRLEKDKSEFRKDNKSKDKLGCWCKDCDREYKRIYYAQNRDKIRQQCRDRYKTDNTYRQKINEHNRVSYQKHKTARNNHELEYRKELQEFVESLRKPCVKCGESRNWLIQFHHVDHNNKKFQIQASHSKENLLKESEKCVCLCSNCHTEYHYFYGKKPKQPKESLDYYLSEEFNYESIKS